VTLGYNVNSPEEVDEVLAQAKAAGGAVPRPGGKTFWGGYSPSTRFASGAGSRSSAHELMQ
jgi:uncharacterized glyoxalase superfamily protein PhnB